MTHTVIFFSGRAESGYASSVSKSLSVKFRADFKEQWAEKGHTGVAMDQVTFQSDTVLSDVHILLPNVRHLMVRLNSVGQPVFVSKFRILREKEQEEVQESEKSSFLDDDGDLDVVRQPKNLACDREKVHPVILSQGGGTTSDEEEDEGDEEECAKDIIKIEHTMATPLDDVGKQIWRGAFLLSDFILSHPDVFREATVLELGAGTGLTSIIMASVAKKVYCTDVGEDLLNMCQRNVSLNSHYIQSAGERGVKVRQLDWTADDFLTDSDAEFSWSEEEVADLHDNTTVVMAADVCYDDDLTDALLRTLYRITSNLRKPSTAYFSIEKRLNFTIRHMDTSCEAYDHFRHCLKQLGEMSDGRMKFTVSPVSCSFPQFLQYERVDQLELWKVSASSL
ncbi:methyltransferase-like protein 22 isoform X1 [Astyanax mexicanus]|uniref:Methyltransferase 22, Kin17 lysine n=1 Tax=Astyanax mexicanus TaxID=7994 RepID=A0A8B9JAF6_ASTMX|nr:methyltransferase-like protein 22 isoform X1 [Astyanax mexicanus]